MVIQGDKVFIVYGESGEPYEGFVHSTTDTHLTIHEYVSNIFRTFEREKILELEII